MYHSKTSNHSRMARCLGLSIMFLTTFLTTPSALAATITVTSNSGGTGGPSCTLRDAITAANTDAVAGGCGAGSGADVIELPAAATITLTAADNGTQGANGLPVISSTISINGNGATIERDTGLSCNMDGTTDVSEFRIAHVTGSLTLGSITLRNGCADGSVLDFTSSGGALMVWVNASLTINNGTITGSHARNTGGGIYTETNSTSTLTQTTVTNNVAHGIGGGGGIRLSGTLSVTDGIISGNQATGGNGGGLLIGLGLGTLLRTTLDSNSASGSGGGAFNFDQLRVTQSTVSNNSAGSSGGGISSTNTANELLVFNSTVSGNLASSLWGGGIWNASSMQLGYSTLTDNTAPDGGGLYIDSNANGKTLQVMNSIVASNLTGNDCGGSVGFLTLMRENLSSDSSCTGFSLPNSNPMLSPLASNGGLTQTHALIHGSPAIDAILAGDCVDFSVSNLTEDQRETLRPYDGNANGQALCDIGAFEQDTPPPPTPPTPIPTLGEWAILALSLIIMGLAAGRLRKVT